MKKNYVRPRADIIYTNVENALLAGSGDGDGGLPHGPNNAKANDFDQIGFSDESLWNDEIDGNNE